MITPDELKALLKQHRWSIAVSKSGRQQVYAAKQRRGKRLATCYIGTANRLQHLTSEDVVTKICSATKRLDSQRGSNDQAQTDHQNGHDGSYMPAIPIIPALG